MKTLIRTMVITLSLLSFTEWSVLAGSIDPPKDLNQFKAGETAVAQQVNENFNVVAGAVNDNDIRRTYILYRFSNTDSSISYTYELLRTLGTFTKTKSNTDLKITWTGHGQMVGEEGIKIFCDFQVRVDNKPPVSDDPKDLVEGSGGRAVLYTNDSPFSVTAIFQGFTAGTRSLSIWVRGNATSCTLNYGNFQHQILVAES